MFYHFSVGLGMAVVNIIEYQANVGSKASSEEEKGQNGNQWLEKMV